MERLKRLMIESGLIGGKVVPPYPTIKMTIFSVMRKLLMNEESLKEQVREVFEIGNHCDVFIPAPPGPRIFVRMMRNAASTPRILSCLFRQARQGIDAIDPDDFANAIKNINEARFVFY